MGAVAGGVIGSVVFVVILVVLSWLWVRKRRQQEEVNVLEWDSDAFEKRDNFANIRAARQSTVGSIASTVLTRASNVLQIAYIPGVTNRSPPESPGILVPPVPPLPLATSPSGALNYNQDDHFFMPGDIRDSVWSGISDDGRKSISPSLARSSVATTIYRNNAVVNPVPAQQALRGKAAVVSVKSGTNSPYDISRANTPAMPTITAAQLSMAGSLNARGDVDGDKIDKMVNSSIVARQMVARPIKISRSTSQLKPNPVPITQGLDSESVASGAPHLERNSLNEESPSESDGDPSSQLAIGKSAVLAEPGNYEAGAVMKDSTKVGQSPFADNQLTGPDSSVSSAIPQELSRPAREASRDARRRSSLALKTGNQTSSSPHRHQNSRSSSRALDDSERQGSSTPPRKDTEELGLSIERNVSPFLDENEAKMP